MFQSTNKRISEQNDQFRNGGSTLPGNVLITNGLRIHLVETDHDIQAVMQIVREFDMFTDDNDPYGEHDFGQFIFAGQSCFWKIDLYNIALDGGSECPDEPDKTHRVLTVMLASDY